MTRSCGREEQPFRELGNLQGLVLNFRQISISPGIRLFHLRTLLACDFFCKSSSGVHRKVVAARP